MWQPCRRWSCPVIWQRITMRWASQQAAAWLEWLQDWYPWFHVSVGTRSACHSWGCERLEECTADRSKGNGRAVRNSMEVGIVFTFCAWDGLLTKKLLLSSRDLPFFTSFFLEHFGWIFGRGVGPGSYSCHGKTCARDWSFETNIHWAQGWRFCSCSEFARCFWHRASTQVLIAWSRSRSNLKHTDEQFFRLLFFMLLSLLFSSGAVSSSSPSLCLRL